MDTILPYNFPTGKTLEIKQGDITLAKTDAIVNAANKLLRHGGGVAGAILHRGGLAIEAESTMWIAEHGPISPAHPAYTTGGEMDCKYVIHVVGPVWGEGEEEDKLRWAIRGALRMGDKLDVRSISFPAVSTGIFGFPADLAADIFMDELFSFCSSEEDHSIKEIAMVLYDEDMYALFAAKFKEWGQKHSG